MIKFTESEEFRRRVQELEEKYMPKDKISMERFQELVEEAAPGHGINDVIRLDPYRHVMEALDGMRWSPITPEEVLNETDLNQLKERVMSNIVLSEFIGQLIRKTR